MFRPLAPLPPDDDVLIRRADLPRYLPIAAQTAASSITVPTVPSVTSHYISIG